MKALQQQSDADGQFVPAIQVSDTIHAGDLVAGTKQDIVVPATAKFAVFSCTGDFWLKDGATAVIPSGALSSGATELNPSVRQVVTGETISVIAAAAQAISVAFYS